MGDLYKNKYRIKSARCENWDYRWDAAYFITICTAHMKHYFGEIKNGKMNFSPIGAIADILWYEIPNHAPYVELGNYIVMPNHIHGILILNNPENISEGNNYDGKKNDQDPKDPAKKKNDSPGNHPPNSVQTLHATSQSHPQQNQKNPQMAKISPKSNSISTIIRSYKSAVTKHAHRLGFEFEWQTRFYDIIIRNEDSFNNISNYIKNNPSNWQKDRFS